LNQAVLDPNVQEAQTFVKMADVLRRTIWQCVNRGL